MCSRPPEPRHTPTVPRLNKARLCPQSYPLETSQSRTPRKIPKYKHVGKHTLYIHRPALQFKILDMRGWIVSEVLHPKCGKRFTNNDTVGHCAACCETFYGLRAFDEHRRGCVCTLPVPSPDKFWSDDQGRWHFGRRMSDEAKAQRKASNEDS